MKRFTVLFGALLLGATTLLAQTFMVDGINYHVISDSEPYMVEVVPLNHAKDESEVYYSGDIVIPEQITYAGITYAVTRLVEGAFQHCKDLHSVEIPNSVTYIGTAAFNGCMNLTSIVISNTITSIEPHTFSQCHTTNNISKCCC